MNISAIAIRRPVFTVMVTIGLLVLGIVGFLRLGTDLFPDVAFPSVMVTVPYPGASPSEMESLVTKPIEDAVNGINGIDRVRSYSREGVSLTIVMFTLGVDLADAATQVRERVAQARYKLPAGIKEPVVNRFDVSQSPILTFTVRGPASLLQLRHFTDDFIAPALEQTEGVAAVTIRGGAVREVQIDLDRLRIDSLGLDVAMVAAKLRSENLNVPAGHFDEGAREVSVRTIGEFSSVDAIRNVVVASARDGSSVRLRDIATVVDGVEEPRTHVHVNGDDAVTFDVIKQSGQNTIQVSDAVKTRIAKLTADFPPGYSVAPIIDQSRFIKNDVHHVERDIVFGGLMAILIIFVFMLDLRSTLISAVALPTSVIGTFFVMYALGYTLNMMTLLGLSLAIGLLIDDAVVVRENIFKHLERGKPPFQAALDGTKEISLSVLATTMTIVAVFLPVAFVKGLVGQFFRQFGITISAAVIISLFVAFTLDPMLSARFSRPIAHGHVDRWARLKRPFERFFADLERAYRGILTWATRHKLVIGGLALLGLVLMAGVGRLMGSEFVNSEDRGQYVLDIELPAGTSLAETSKLSNSAELALLRHPDVQIVYATIGPGGEVNRASWRVVVKPKGDRTTTIAELKEAGRTAATTTIPNAKVFVAEPPFIEGAATEAPIMIAVRGANYPEIEKVAGEILSILNKTPGVRDVQMKYSAGRPELQLMMDRERAAEKGLTLAQLAMSLRGAVEGEEATNYRDGKDEITVRVRLKQSDRATAADLTEVTMMTARGPVRVADVATFRRSDGPQVIEREGRSRQIVIWGAPYNRALGDIVRDIRPQISALNLAPGMSVAYDGQIRMMGETNANLALAMGLGIIFIYLVLASQFESFVHPLTIMLTLPLALVGAIFALFLTNHTMAMGALIGIILLMGLVTKNAILLIDRAIVRVRDLGESPLQAILQAGPERLRPILMTSAAMVLGMLPTAIGNGEGSEFRGPMAIAVIGGVVSSTLLSLVVVPVFYLAIESLRRPTARRKVPYGVTTTSSYTQSDPRDRPRVPAPPN